MKLTLLTLLLSCWGQLTLATPRTFSSFRSYFAVCTNPDSLENAVYAHKDNSLRYLHELIWIENNRVSVSDKFGDDLPTIKLLANQHNSPLATAAYHYLYGLHIRELNLGNAARSCLEAIQYAEAKNDTTGMMTCYFSMLIFNANAAVYKINHMESPNYYYDRIMDLGQKSTSVLDKLIRIRAILFFEKRVKGKQDYTNTIPEANEALRLMNHYPLAIPMQVSVYTGIASFYDRHEGHKQAFAYQLKAFGLAKNSRSKISSTTYYNLGTSYFSIGAYKESEAMFVNAIQVLETLKEEKFALLINAYSQLSDIQFLNKQYKTAWATRNKTEDLLNKRHRKLQSNLFEEFSTQYDLEQKEQTNRQLQKEKQRLYMYLGSGFIFWLLIGFALLRLRLANGRIKELMKHRDQFYTLVAHDLRGPINTLTYIGSVVNFLVKNNRTAELVNITNQIESVSSQTQFLLSNMLEWGETNNYGLISKPQIIDLRTIVDKLYETAKPLADVKQILMSMDIPAHLEVVADPKAVSTIIRNMIDNAKKNTASGGVIQLFAEKLDKTKQIILHVKDSGRGIPAEQLAYIQQVFLGKIKPEIGDHGLGLGIILMTSFAQTSHASLQVTSEVGVGSCFSLVLSQY